MLFLPWPEALVYKKCGCWVGWEIGHAGSKRKAKQLSRPKALFADIFAFHSSCCLEKQCRIHVACNCGAKYVPCSKRSADCHLRRRRPCTLPRTLACLPFSQASSRKIVADFLLGRGQSKLQLQPPDLGAKNAIVNDVKSGFEQEMAHRGARPHSLGTCPRRRTMFVACRLCCGAQALQLAACAEFCAWRGAIAQPDDGTSAETVANKFASGNEKCHGEDFCSFCPDAAESGWQAFGVAGMPVLGCCESHDHVPPELRNSKVPRMSIEGIDPKFLGSRLKEFYVHFRS